MNDSKFQSSLSFWSVLRTSTLANTDFRLFRLKSDWLPIEKKREEHYAHGQNIGQTKRKVDRRGVGGSTPGSGPE